MVDPFLVGISREHSRTPTHFKAPLFEQTFNMRMYLIFMVYDGVRLPSAARLLESSNQV